jgi:hypothetical protein
MSNELTPQEKYPNFYKYPHLFVGKLMVRDNKSIWYEKDTEFDGYLCAKCFDYMDIQDFTPIFKPQEGEQFIKDLESAVSAGNIFNYKLSYKDKDKNGHYLFTGDKDGHPLLLMVNSAKLSMVAYAVGEDLIALPFNTAAYVDTLRKLGYYL